MLPADPGPRSFRYSELESIPDDNVRRELLDGELIVAPSPTTRHQRAVMNLSLRLGAYRNAHGGEALPAPTDVYLAEDNVLQPDLLFVSAEHLDRVKEHLVEGPPDLVIEVSSPSTRGLDLVRKRDLYARFEVPEYWYVDLDAERVEVYRLSQDGYRAPELKYPGTTLSAPHLPGLEVDVEEALGKPPGRLKAR